MRTKRAGIVEKGFTIEEMGNIVQKSMYSTEDLLGELSLSDNQLWLLETILDDLETKVACYKQENKALRRMLSQTDLVEEALCQ